ncbi:uncharacterized protein UBRO_08139 [Ustilago bromivora]|uniref:Effector family protein Eff1 n=1 Tax=Ustilago bromivora TaxID=307758 RepID=A0A1K0GBX7_9BASI|nr:uncharacterized protein UBRO_08139 [Ustilago bromivora]SYW80501.1 uncharacterized protein UBRO2_03769 [Ustilago bromivora]
MKLSGMFRIGFVAAIVTALILLPSCIATVGSSGASTSTSQPDLHTPGSSLSLQNYIDHLKANEIIQLRGLNRFAQGKANIYDKVPFTHTKVFLDDISTAAPSLIRAPLYSIDTPLSTVKQALRDYQYVGIVDVSKQDARLIQVVKDPTEAYLKQEMFPDTQKLIQLFELDPNLHHLRNLVRSLPVLQPSAEDIKHLPQFQGKPILSQGSENIGHMFRAASTNPQEFYYLQNGKQPILVNPRTDDLFHSGEQEVHRIGAEYQNAKQKYGQTIASIIWGEPIKVSADPHGLRKSHIKLKNYPRFNDQATRDDMVTALQRYGRFRVYKNVGPNQVAYKVKMANPESIGAPLEVSVKPLTRLERLQERFHLPRIRLP